MAQHDYILENQPGAAFRGDLNAAMQAIVSQNSGATEPEQTFAFQWWADTTSGVLKQRNAGNNDWNDILDLTTGRPTGAVAQTGATGAVLLPEGDDSERPSPIPAGGALLRGSNQDPADYKLEFWNRVSAAWQVLASRSWVIEKINELINGAIGFTIIYPNGGTEAAPANIINNQRLVSANPFPGKAVICEVQLLIGGVWGDPGWADNAAAEIYGTRAGQLGSTGDIVVQSGAKCVAGTSNIAGGVHGYAGTLTTAPVRVKVWKVG